MTKDIFWYGIQIALGADQLLQCQAALDSFSTGPVFDAWALMKSLRAGLTQEWLDTLEIDVAS